MEQLLSRTGGLLNRLIGGPQQLGLGALMYGSSEIQKPLKSMFGLPSTGDYLRQWEAQSGATSQRPPKPNGNDLRDYGSRYKELELAAGAAAERFRLGAGFPGQQSAADRAYEAEKSRVAQLTAQDPELQRYKKARKDAKTQEEMNAARDIGMQIWQQKYGGTPMGQPGGAVGMDNPLMLKTFGYQSGSAPGQQMGAYTQGPTPNIPQIDQMLNPAGPSYLGGEGAPLINFADENFTPEMIEAYQKQLLGQAAARK